MLRLVHPAPSGQATDPPARRRGSRSPALCLTSDERRHLRASLQNLRRAYGTWACLAMAMDVPMQTLTAAGQRGKGSAMLAIRAAKAGGMSVEAVLGGTLNPAGRCTSCGSRIGAQGAGGAS